MAGSDEPGGVEETSVTRREFEEIVDGLSELREAVQGLNAARTPEERRDARDDIQDAEESLEQTAKRLGVSPDSLQKSIRAARDAERKEELRGPLQELLQELGLSKPDSDDGKDGKDDKPKPKPKPKPAAAAAGEPPQVEDTEPVKPHWSERAISEALR